MFAVIDLRLLQDSLNKPDFLKPPNQIWMLYMLECPLHTGIMSDDNFSISVTKISFFATWKPVLLELILKFEMLYFLWRTEDYHFNCECSGSVLQPDLVNWTATYRSDSTIVTPYEKWVYHDDTVKARTQQINYAAGKTKKVAFFVSNCGARSVDFFNLFYSTLAMWDLHSC